MSDSDVTIQGVMRAARDARDARDSDSDSSDDESSYVDKMNFAKRRQSYRSVLSETVSVNPSPRVSTYERPNRIFLINRNDDSDVVVQTNRRRALKVVILSSFFICIVALIATVVVLVSQSPETPFCHFNDGDYVIPSDFETPEVLDDLTPLEYYDVKRFVLQNESMGVTNFDSASVNSSYIYMIDLLLPNKNETISYLDGSHARPSRDAIVTIVRGNWNPPIVEEYIVSPARNPQSVSLFKNPSNTYSVIPYESRPLDFIDFKNLIPFVINKLTEQMYPLLVESFGLHYHNCTSGVDCLKIVDKAPYERKNGSRKTWFWLFPDVEGYYLQPLGLSFLIDHTSTSTTEWKVKQIIYNKVRYNSVTDIMKAYDDKTLNVIHCRMCRKPNKYMLNNGRGLPHPKVGPKLFEPEGKRYSIKGQRLIYNLWRLRYGMRATTGLQLFDLCFNGSRIAYEISLQEILVMYAENDRQNTVSSIYHTPRLLGASTTELVKGIDCPDTALYLNSFILANSENVKAFKDNICVFENYGAQPVARQQINTFDNGYESYRGVSNYHLVIRSIASMWNSNFVFDYILHNNGAIETKVSKTGSIRATFHSVDGSSYNSPTVDHVFGEINVDLFNYKIDLDIAGVTNRYSTIDLDLDSVLERNRNPQLNIKTQTINKESIDNIHDANKFQYHLFTGASEVESKAYRILNKSPVPGSLSTSGKSGLPSWATNPIIITKRKERERSSSCIFVNYDSLSSINNFDKFIDGDSIANEDLVAWVTVGSHHIPGSEDIPTIQTTWNTHSFILVPHNYFTHSPDVNDKDTMVIKPSNDPDRKYSMVIYGDTHETMCIPKSRGVKQYDGVHHDYV
ncbi:tryptamine:oxygen oxidoreductase (deaminating) [Mactra antiquata]